MNKLKISTHALLGVLCALVIHSKSFAEPINISLIKLEARAYHDTGAYDQELSKAIEPAKQYIIQRALANKISRYKQRLAIVLDIDETSITNYDNMLARDFAYDEDKWHKDILAANAPAIEPMYLLYKIAIEKNIAVFFVTGRSEIFQKSTVINLKHSKYQSWEGLYLRPSHYKSKSIVPFKVSARAAIEKQGYTIIASIGDQKSDLTGGHAETTVKLPNPFYYIP